jgi:hypothetical protein
VTKNYEGHVFSRLTAVRRLGRATNGVAIWLCRCECGNEKEVTQSNLVSGNVRSCGCLVIDTFTTHAMTDSAEYRAWCHMKERCSNRRVHNYHRYGGRGIRVCDRWVDSFENFLADMGPRPSPEYSLDRFPDPDGNYEPGNCRWATVTQQTRNRRTNRILAFDGREQTLTDWCEELDLVPSIVSTRLRRGWTVQRALTTPMPGSFPKPRRSLAEEAPPAFEGFM